MNEGNLGDILRNAITHQAQQSVESLKREIEDLRRENKDLRLKIELDYWGAIVRQFLPSERVSSFWYQNPKLHLITQLFNAEIIRLIEQDRRIEAIKLLRNSIVRYDGDSTIRMGLKDAKDLVDYYREIRDKIHFSFY